jgi:hypothetical protein
MDGYESIKEENVRHLTRNQINQAARWILGDMLPGRVEQSIYEASAVQNYALGSRKIVDIGGSQKTYHYCKAGAAITLNCRLVGCLDQILAADDRILTIAAALGAVQMSVPHATAAKDEYVGGVMEIWTSPFQFRTIVANSASSGGQTIVTLDHPVSTAAAIGVQVVLHHLPYRKVGPMGVAMATFESAVCLPPIAVPINNFFWGLTYGLCFIEPQAPWPGSAADRRDIYCWQDGTVVLHEGSTPATKSMQRVGYGVESGNYGTGVMMLQLDP